SPPLSPNKHSSKSRNHHKNTTNNNNNNNDDDDKSNNDDDDDDDDGNNNNTNNMNVDNIVGPTTEIVRKPSSQTTFDNPQDVYNHLASCGKPRYRMRWCEVPNELQEF